VLLSFPGALAIIAIAVPRIARLNNRLVKSDELLRLQRLAQIPEFG
jgi:hypothetical protein